MAFKLNPDAKVKIPTKIIIPIAACIMGIVFLISGITSHGFWDSELNAPTPTFFPIIISIAQIAVSILALVQALKEEKDKKMTEYRLLNWFVPMAFVSLMVSCLLIGTVPSVIVFLLLWIKVYEKSSWKTTIIALVIVLFIVVGCFMMWLDIDFPIGLIFEPFFG